MDENKQRNGQPHRMTRSTLLIPGAYFDRFFAGALRVHHTHISGYLNRLMNDPELGDKLKLLKIRKWKKEYQDKGQSLQRVNFYPDERDWARLSTISNATGFSRCYIFVFLMLINMGLIPYKSGGTQPSFSLPKWNYLIRCEIEINASHAVLSRILQT